MWTREPITLRAGTEPFGFASRAIRAGEADPLDVANTPMVRGGGSLRYLLLLSLLDGKFLEGDRASGW